MSVMTASGAPLDVLGGVFVAISVGTGIFKKTSIQMAYISESVNQVFLSEDALKDLDILPRKWPKQENVGVCTMDSVVNKDSEIVSCSDKTEVLSSEKMRCEVNTPGHASDGDQVHLEVLGLGEVPIEATDKWEEEIKAEEMEGTIQG